MKRPEQWDQWTDGKELTAMAAHLHAVANGSADPDGREAGYATALRWAADHWEPGRAEEAAYDCAVLAQVLAALRERGRKAR